MRCRQATLSLALTVGLALAVTAHAQTPTRLVGSVTAVSGNTLTVKPDNAAPSTVAVGNGARILRTLPGAKTLAGATAITLTDLAVGDRVLVVENDGTATTVVAMKQADIAQKQQADAADWQHRGAGGLVKTVDAAAGAVTIAAGARTLTIHTTPKTIVRHYSPDSIQFVDAKPSSLDQIHPGDQLRVRGDRSADGAEITADEIIAGSFRNIAGTVLSTQPADNTITVTDLVTKKPVLIHITAESQLHRLPAMMAAGLAARLAHPGAGAGSGAAAASGPAAATGNGSAPAEQHSQSASWRQNGGAPGQRGGDLSQMLERTPTVAISDLHKGDAVMIVATQGTPGSATAVTLLAGVEPILTASPAASQSMFSASWSLGGGGDAGGEGTQ
jgi:hypothetical protein